MVKAVDREVVLEEVFLQPVQQLPKELAAKRFMEITVELVQPLLGLAEVAAGELAELDQIV